MILNKYLAHAGITSRRKAVELIKAGSVAVNKTIIKDPAFVVPEGAVVTLHGKKIVLQEPLYVLINKPAGIVTTTADEKGRKTVIDLVERSFKKRLYPVGRLDRNTTGLLLLTNDGTVAQKLAHPKYKIRKVYQIALHAPFTESAREQLLKGVKLRDGLVKAERVSHALGAKKNQVRVTLTSGKNRILRRLFEALGYQIKKLDRIQYGFFSKRGLPLGSWRKLAKKEITQLKKLIEPKEK